MAGAEFFVALLTSLLILMAATSSVSGECFSCISNPNWQFYQNRIPGLKQLNFSAPLPVAPISCTFDPMRIYADRNAVACRGYCIKWSSAIILADGGLEVNFLRGCYDALIDPNLHMPPQDDKCYQTPSDMNHEVGVEYISTCYCKGFMCNSAPSIHKLSAIFAVPLVLLSKLTS